MSKRPLPDYPHKQYTGVSQFYLYSTKSIAHLWNGKDTECRMWSTYGLKRRSYAIHPTSDGRKVCQLCMSLCDVNTYRRVYEQQKQQWPDALDGRVAA